MKAVNILIAIFFSLNLFAQLDRVTQPEGTYPYWPVYLNVEDKNVTNIRAQEWKPIDHSIEGWDWSLPTFVKPALGSSVGLQRNFGLTKEFFNFNLQFPANPTGLLWVNWRDIEKTPGVYDFSGIIDRIKQAQSVGVKISLRILAHSKSRGTGSGEAPLWLESLGVTLLPQNDPSNNLNFNPAHPEFHKRYLMLINELAKTDIPKLVRNAYVGYASPSFGDEGIGPYGEGNSAANDTVQHVRERLDAWQKAFNGLESKIFMGGSCDYGFQKGFGVRRGFVEMYLYNIPNRDMGQYIDSKGYLRIDESSPIIKYNCFNGEVNEEYESAWATESRDYRFGISTISFPYRYFISNLRALKMQCTYVHTTGHLLPQMLPFMALELGRTVEDAPDVWAFLNTSYLQTGNYKNKDWKGRTFSATEETEGIETKNFERWLYQRDTVGYQTQPDVKIQQAIKMWMVQTDKYYDYIARSGKKIGFDIDNRWTAINDSLAIKVTCFDKYAGNLNLVYNNGDIEDTITQSLLGDGKLKTLTFIIPKIKANSMPNNFDFTLEAGTSTEKIVVSMVRVVQAVYKAESTIKKITTSAVNGTVTSIPTGGQYEVGSTVTVTAVPNNGFQFSNWTDANNAIYSTNPYSFTVLKDRQLVANFSLIPLPSYKISLSVKDQIGGTVTGSGTYNQNQSVTISATAATGYKFVNWTENGTVISAEINYTFIATKARSLVANFLPITYEVSISAYPSEGGSVSGGGTFNSGKSALISATPASGYSFVNWTESDSPVSTYSPYFFIVTKDRNLVANFLPITKLTINEQSSFRIFPNPANRILNIEFLESNPNKPIRIYNHFGQLVFDHLANSNITQIDLKSFESNGVFCIQIVDKNKVLNHKVVVNQ